MQINWHVEKRKVTVLKNWEQNPRTITRANFLRLKEKILEQGFHAVLVIDSDDTVLAGNQRLEVLRDVGMEEVNVILPDRKLTDRERAKVALSDNKHEGEDNWDLLVNFDEEILRDVGFLMEDISKHFDISPDEDNFDAEKEYQAIQVPQTKLGDLYKLGDHRILCGDAEKKEDWAKLMGNEKAKLVFTDPPYNVDYKSPGGMSYDSSKFGGTGGKIFNDDKSDAECLRFYTKVLEQMHKFSEDNATIYWWFANKNNWINREAFEQAGWHMSQIIIWLKNSMIFSRGQDYHRCYEPCMLGWKKGKSHYSNKKYADFKDTFSLDYDSFIDQMDVWFERRDNTAQYLHPTQKPIRLAERSLRKNSNAGDLVVDGFLGSGSTLIACEQMGRKCFGMELDPKYVDVEVKRWETLTHQKAEKISAITD